MTEISIIFVHSGSSAFSSKHILHESLVEEESDWQQKGNECLLKVVVVFEKSQNKVGVDEKRT